MCRRAVILLAAALWAGTWSCSSEEVDHPAAAQEYTRLQRAEQQAPDDQVVARAAGRPITRDAARAYWREHPELGRREVIEALIDRELLLAHEPPEASSGFELELGRKRGLARAWLAHQVEDVGPVELPEGEAAQELIASQRASMGAPAGLQASHLLALAPADESSPDEREQARRAAERLRAQLGERATLADLQRLRERAFLDESQDVRLVINPHLRFPRPGIELAREALPEGWTPVVEPFGRAAEALAERGPGALSEPVETQFGWHLIVFEEVLEPAPVEQARAVIKARLKTRKRRERFTERAGQIASRSDWVSYPELLAEDETGERIEAGEAP